MSHDKTTVHAKVTKTVTVLEPLRMMLGTMPYYWLLPQTLSFMLRAVPRLKSKYLQHITLMKTGDEFECIFTVNIMVTCLHSGGVPDLKNNRYTRAQSEKNLKEASCLLLLLELPRNVDLGEGDRKSVV